MDRLKIKDRNLLLVVIMSLFNGTTIISVALSEKRIKETMCHFQGGRLFYLSPNHLRLEEKIEGKESL